MKKNKIIKFLTGLVIIGGVISSAAFAAETQGQQNSTVEKVIQESENTTTSSAAKITNEDVQKNIIEEQRETIDLKVPKLKSEIEGDARIGATITVKVIGYNAEGEKVDLNTNKLSYKWYAQDEDPSKSDDDSKKTLIGSDKELLINEELKEKFITCTVIYEGGLE